MLNMTFKENFSKFKLTNILIYPTVSIISIFKCILQFGALIKSAEEAAF